MDSPCSPQLADLVIEFLEEDIFKKNQEPFFYIDDSYIIICVFEIENLINAFLVTIDK